MEPEGSLPHSQVPATCPYPEPARTGQTPTSHFLKINLNIILPSMSGSPKWSLSFRFSHQNPVYVFHLPHTCYMPRPAHYSQFYNLQNIGLGVQIIKLFVMFFSTPLLPRPSWAQIFSSTPYSHTLSAYVPLPVWATKFHTHTKQQAKLYFSVS